MKKLVVQGYIFVPGTDLESIRAALPSHIAITRRENGCLVFNVQQRANEPNIFDVYEEFEDREAFQYHQKRAAESAWGQVSRNVERYYSQKIVCEQSGNDV